MVDRETGRVRLAYNVPPTAALDPLGAVGSRFGLPVLIDNNINLAALGEKSFGLARGVSTMVFIGIGAGVGMGIIMHDELVRGAHGAAGEISYLPLVGDPFDPRHRLHGGLEDEVAAAGALAVARRTGAGAERLRARAPQEVFELAAPRPGMPAPVVDHVASRLGAAIATVCAILDPELVVLGGGIGSSPLLLRPVRGAAAALVPITSRIETSLLGDRAALKGAIAVALQAARTQLIPRAAPPGPRASARGQPARGPEEQRGRDHDQRCQQALSGRDAGGARPRPGDRRRRVHDPRRPVGLRQDDAAAHDRGARGDHRGKIEIGERIVNDLTPKDRDIAMVFQNYALYPHMTVAKNMGFALRRAGVPAGEIRRKVETADLLGIAEQLERKPANLSGGQRQRVAMGRAIVRDPKAFLMDEPLSNLDAKLRIQMRAEILRIQRRLSTTTVYVTHDQTEAMTLGDRLAVMRDGVLQQVGTPAELYDRPRNVFVAGSSDRPR